MINKIVIKNYRRIKNLTFRPLDGMNVVVGANESGKSTLLEALTTVLTGRVNGRWAQEELNPYWFNAEEVAAFFSAVGGGKRPAPPSILIEVYFSDDNHLQKLRGTNNSLHEDAPGLQVVAELDEAYQVEFSEYLASQDRPDILPTEYYTVRWTDFSGEGHRQRPRGLGVSFIDSRTIRSTSGVDHHTRQMLADNLTDKEGAAISVAYRRARHKITQETLQQVNDRIKKSVALFGDRTVGLQMDQSSTASWEVSVVPQVDSIPFAMAGQGQQVAIKIALALHKDADTTSFILIEEPENHLSHTSLTKVVKQIEDLSTNRQTFVTTHSSFVLNRLGLDRLHLISGGSITHFTNLTPDTVEYFRLQSGYDTLRMVLAERVVLVEGPSDEMIFNRAYQEKHGLLPIEDGVDVITQGTRSRRGLELCASLNRQAAILRDNDGKEPSYWIEKASKFIVAGVREMFIGPVEDGETLEPQMIRVNDGTMLKEVIGCPEDDDLATYMKNHKTDVAWAIATTKQAIAYPKYFHDAIGFIKP
jgi:predicted ATPase